MGRIVGAPTLSAIGSLVSLRVALTAASVALLPVIPIYRRYRTDQGAEATWCTELQYTTDAIALC